MSKFIMLAFAICIKEEVSLMGAGKLKYVKTQDNNKTLVLVRTTHMEFGGKETVGIANSLKKMPLDPKKTPFSSIIHVPPAVEDVLTPVKKLSLIHI